MICLKVSKIAGVSLAIVACREGDSSIHWRYSCIFVITLLSGGYPTTKLSVLRVRISNNYCPELGYPTTKLSVLRVRTSNNYCPEGIQPPNYLSWGSEYQTIIVQRVSNQPPNYLSWGSEYQTIIVWRVFHPQLICLEGKNTKMVDGRDTKLDYCLVSMHIKRIEARDNDLSWGYL